MNKVTLMGRLTKDPELRYTNSNTAVANFTLAVNRRFGKPGEEKQADFINCVAWDKSAEFCNQYFKKGQQVVVIGRIATSTYEKDGVKHYKTEVVVEENYFADSKKGDAPQTNSGELEPTEDELPF